MMTNIIEVQNWQMRFENYSGDVRKMNRLGNRNSCAEV